MQDVPIDLDELTELVDSSAFKLEQVQMRPFEWSPATVMALSIEMRLDQLVISRETVTVMDVMADIGGFAVVLTVVAGVILHLLDQGHVSNVLATQLFKVAPPAADIDELNQGSLPLTMPSRCLSCCSTGRKRQHKAMKLARSTLNEELDVVELIRTLRCFRIILSQLFTDEECAELTRASQFLEVDPDRGYARAKDPVLKHIKKVMPVNEVLATSEVEIASPRSQGEPVKIKGPSCSIRKKTGHALGAAPAGSVSFADAFSETCTTKRPKDTSKNAPRILSIVGNPKVTRHSAGSDVTRLTPSLPPLVKRRSRKRPRNLPDLQRTMDPSQAMDPQLVENP